MVAGWSRWSLYAFLLTLLSFINPSTQQVLASNNSADIPPYDSSPRYWFNGTSNPSSNNFPPFEALPLGWYAQTSQQVFLSIQISGRLVYIDSSNANNFTTDTFDYISCDMEDYPGNLGPNDVFQMVLNSNSNNGIVFYSTRANHCQAGDLHTVSVPNGVFTTLDPVLAAAVRDTLLNRSAIGMPALLSPDTYAYTKPTGPNGPSSSPNAPPGPTTPVAMAILYTVTGLITALFVVVIVTGAVRAHRHPDRYGPSNEAGRPRRSRAKGIARAMLDTIPIVKFGENKEDDGKKEVSDIELASTISTASAPKGKAVETVQEKEIDEQSSNISPTSNADGTDEAGQLGCSICTEDFTKGDEVRVLPCNHKFHPDCVDPWLLNVSGTCPLCRIDLRPREEQDAAPLEPEASDSQPNLPRRDSMYDAVVAPPLGHLPLRLDRNQDRRERRPSNGARRDTVAFARLRSVAQGSREDRIAALRRFRQQRTRNESEEQQPEEERRSLAGRLSERFRIRTRRAGEEDAAMTEESSQSSNTGPTPASAPSSAPAPVQGRLSSAGMPRATWQA